MNHNQPVYFSDYFNIDKLKLKQLGVFDPILNFDTKVFVEPLLLKESSNKIIKESYKNYTKFFADLLTLLQTSTSTGDKCWRAAKKMVDFPEYPFTCIGYSSGNTDGRGSGIEFNDKILHSAIEIIDKANGNPEIFLLLPLLEEGIAGDRISDMVQNIIDDDICKYTQDIMNKLGLEGNCRHSTRNHNTYKLLLNPFSKKPIKLIPYDILLNLPVADNIDSLIEEMTSHNTRLRDLVNRDIGCIWLDTTKAQRKAILLKEIKNNREFFIETLKALKEYKFEHYDLETDYEGLYKWLEDSQDFINFELAKEIKNCPDNLNSLDFAITAIIKHFKDTIENKEVWRTFWTKCNLEYKHVRVYYSQMLFFTVCNSWLTSQDSNININLIHSTKNIDLEFSVSDKHRLIVHIKHANNPTLKTSYEKILETFRGSDNEKHIYLIMNFKEEPANQLKEVKIIENPICKIFEVNVTNRNNTKENDLCAFPDFDWGFPEFEDINFTDDRYIKEKRKGGENSYQAYKPLRDKVTELCTKELGKKNYDSANLLCNKVANIIEKKYPHLLNSFQPYQNHEFDGNDWKRPTFYSWCNNLYKAHYSAKENETA
ncbi:MAG: hypothetical protein J0H68_00275 [Sphingobacteriia bacterium]|nr:hypothetical protein [Sphingobacteriia bacterium]